MKSSKMIMIVFLFLLSCSPQTAFRAGGSSTENEVTSHVSLSAGETHYWKVASFELKNEDGLFVLEPKEGKFSLLEDDTAESLPPFLVDSNGTLLSYGERLFGADGTPYIFDLVLENFEQDKTVNKIPVPEELLGMTSETTGQKIILNQVQNNFLTYLENISPWVRSLDKNLLQEVRAILKNYKGRDPHDLDGDGVSNTEDCAPLDEYKVSWDSCGECASSEQVGSCASEFFSSSEIDTSRELLFSDSLFLYAYKEKEGKWYQLMVTGEESNLKFSFVLTDRNTEENNLEEYRSFDFYSEDSSPVMKFEEGEAKLSINLSEFCDQDSNALCAVSLEAGTDNALSLKFLEKENSGSTFQLRPFVSDSSVLGNLDIFTFNFSKDEKSYSFCADFEKNSLGVTLTEDCQTYFKLLANDYTSCGDGIEQWDEECDTKGVVLSSCEYGTRTCSSCSSSCTLEEITGSYCGDGVKNGNETCDDGNTTTETACVYGSATCTSCKDDCLQSLNLAGSYCGDGTKNTNETCDDGNTTTEIACAYGSATCTACNAECSASLSLTGSVCGDGTKDENETCDDGNTETEIACAYGSATCTACKADCSKSLSLTGSYCGDSVKNGNEICDDGNTTTEIACAYGSATCTSCKSDCSQSLNLAGSFCGDGTKNTNETCDDGNTTTEIACAYGSATCTACKADCSKSLSLTGSYCGDSVKNGNEICDDGNTTTETACAYGSATCTSCKSDCSQSLNLAGSFCGDGTKNTNETCDDGNTTTEIACAYGSATCTTCKADCSGSLALTGSYCGDSVKNGNEICDDGNTTTEIACAYGSATCTSCKDDCLQSLSLTGSYCGDSVKNGNETCDDGNTETEEACPYGSATCSACNAECSESLALTGSYCGDGTKDTSETCDDGNISNNDGCSLCVVQDGYRCCEDGVQAVSKEEATTKASIGAAASTWVVNRCPNGSVLTAYASTDKIHAFHFTCTELLSDGNLGDDTEGFLLGLYYSEELKVNTKIKCGSNKVLVGLKFRGPGTVLGVEGACASVDSFLSSDGPGDNSTKPWEILVGGNTGGLKTTSFCPDGYAITGVYEGLSSLGYLAGMGLICEKIQDKSCAPGVDYCQSCKDLNFNSEESCY